MSVSVNMKQLLEAGVHYGHQTRRWNPKMSHYIYGARNGIHIIDLQKTVKMFQKACNFLESTTARGGHVLFVGTKRLARDMVDEETRRSNQYFINHRWLGGTLTNFSTIRQSIHRLRKIERMSQDGTFQKLTKKEVLMLSREREKLERNLGGIKDMPGLPSALFVVDAHKETIAIREAKRLGIPVVAIADTNSDPTIVDYPIPGNDDSIKALRLFISTAAEACAAGRSRAKDQVSEKGERGPSVAEGSFRDDKGNRVNVEKK
ncbi:MAG: 30S ribosomal protein S2 [Oligoflexus sp.]